MNNNNFKINFQNSEIVGKTAKTIKSITNKVLVVLKEPEIDLSHNKLLDLLAQSYGYGNYTDLIRNLNKNEPQIDSLDDEKKLFLYNLYEIKLEKIFLNQIKDEYRLLVIRTIIQYLKYQYTDAKYSGFFSYKDIGKKYSITIPSVKKILQKNELLVGNYPSKSALEYNKVFPRLFEADEEDERYKTSIKLYWDKQVIEKLFLQVGVSEPNPIKKLSLPSNMHNAQDKLNEIAENMFDLYKNILWKAQSKEQLEINILFPITMELSAWQNTAQIKILFAPFFTDIQKLSKNKKEIFKQYNESLQGLLSWIEKWQKKNKGRY